MKTSRNRNGLWGILMLAIAALIITNQLGWFERFSFGTIVAAAAAVGFFFHFITQRSVNMIPLIVAAAYIVLSDFYLVPNVSTGVIIAAAVFAYIGLGYLFPQSGSNVAFFGFCGDEDDQIWAGDETEARGNGSRPLRGSVKTGEMNNNPSVFVTFGGVSRYLRADALETVHLNCTFGGMDIYLDQTQLSPHGATVHINCMFGGIDIYVPRHWHVIEDISCVFGGAETGKRLESLAENAPQLTVTGNVMFGGVDINYI